MQALTLWKYLVRCGLNRLLTAHRRLQPRQSEPRSSGAPLLAALFAREVGIVADTGMLNNRARNCRLFTQVEMNPRTCDMYHRHMPVPLTDVTAFILAGGKSTRMGTDKAFVELEGRPLLSRALDIARSVTLNVNIVGDPRKFAAYATVVEDIFPNCGPLGGIHAALCASGKELNLVAAVDLRASAVVASLSVLIASGEFWMAESMKVDFALGIAGLVVAPAGSFSNMLM